MDAGKLFHHIVAVRQLDLSCRQIAVLFECREHSGLSIRHHASRLKLSKPAVTRAIDKMEGMGLVSRKVDPHDRRSCILGLTAPGNKLLAELEKA